MICLSPIWEIVQTPSGATPAKTGGGVERPAPPHRMTTQDNTRSEDDFSQKFLTTGRVQTNVERCTHLWKDSLEIFPEATIIFEKIGCDIYPPGCAISRVTR